MESPEFVKISTAAAMALGFIPGLFYRSATTYCINLLMVYRDSCRANCAYCGLARSRKLSPGEKSFIRVDWPIFPLDQVLSQAKKLEDKFKRVCLSMITHPKARKDVIFMVEKMSNAISLPISVLLTPTLMRKGELASLKEAGVDMVGIAIDASTPELFDRLRGKGVSGPHSWTRYWEGASESVEIFGRRKVGCHFIAGLGEREKEIAFSIQRAYDLGATTHLFSFFPEEGSMMEDHPQPPLSCYRRVQLVRYLIDNGISRYERMQFSEDGRVEDFGISGEELDAIIDSGEPFMTSGCPARDGSLACNRPYSNERPSQPIRNFPFRPSREDIEEIRRQLGSD